MQRQTRPFDLRQDMFVRSAWSDATTTVAAHVERAEALGLSRVCLVERVNAGTWWLPQLVAAAQSAARGRRVEVAVGVEAPIADSYGRLELPRLLPPEVTFVMAAEDRFPLGLGALRAREVRRLRASGEVRAEALVQALVAAIRATMTRFRRPGRSLVLAQPLSLLKRVGLSEELISSHHLFELGIIARDTGTLIAIDERWRCPDSRSVAAFLAAGATLVCASGAEHGDAIARNRYARELAQGLRVIEPPTPTIEGDRATQP